MTFIIINVLRWKSNSLSNNLGFCIRPLIVNAPPIASWENVIAKFQNQTFNLRSVYYDGLSLVSKLWRIGVTYAQISQCTVYTSLHQKKEESLFPILLSALPTILQISLFYKTSPHWESNSSLPPASRLRVQHLTQSAKWANAASLQNLILKPHACYT